MQGYYGLVSVYSLGARDRPCVEGACSFVRVCRAFVNAGNKDHWLGDGTLPDKKQSPNFQVHMMQAL